MFALHLLAEFHDMPISSIIKDYIVLNTTYKKILIISSYILVVHTIFMRLRWAYILVNHLCKLLTIYVTTQRS